MTETVADSSVLVSAFIRTDPKFLQAWRMYRSAVRGDTVLHVSALVPVEVCGALRRRRGADLADRFCKEFRLGVRRGFIVLYGLTSERMEAAIVLALRHGLKGADAVILQVAQEIRMPIETYDDEIAKAAQRL